MADTITEYEIGLDILNERIKRNNNIFTYNTTRIRYPTEDSNKEFAIPSIKKYLTEQDKTINSFGLKSYLATFNYDTGTTYSEAWSSVREKTDSAVSALINSGIPIHQLSSTIEFVPTIPKTHKTSEVHISSSLDELKYLFMRNIDPSLPPYDERDEEKNIEADNFMNTIMERRIANDEHSKAKEEIKTKTKHENEAKKQAKLEKKELGEQKQIDEDAINVAILDSEIVKQDMLNEEIIKQKKINDESIATSKIEEEQTKIEEELVKQAQIEEDHIKEKSEKEKNILAGINNDIETNTKSKFNIEKSILNLRDDLISLNEKETNKCKDENTQNQSLGVDLKEKLNSLKNGDNNETDNNIKSEEKDNNNDISKKRTEIISFNLNLKRLKLSNKELNAKKIISSKLIKEYETKLNNFTKVKLVNKKMRDKKLSDKAIKDEKERKQLIKSKEDETKKSNAVKNKAEKEAKKIKAAEDKEAKSNEDRRTAAEIKEAEVERKRILKNEKARAARAAKQKRVSQLNLINIDPMKYTECLINIVTEMIYLKKFSSKDSELAKWLYDKQDELAELSYSGKPYNFEYVDELDEYNEQKKKEEEDRMKASFKEQKEYTDIKKYKKAVWDKKKKPPSTTKEGEDYRRYTRKFNKRYTPTLALFLAHTQEQLGCTTLGFPHGHIQLLSESVTDYMALEDEIKNIIKDATQLIDVKVDRHKKSPASPTSAMEYILKNHSTSNTSFPLAKFTDLSRAPGYEFAVSVDDKVPICRTYINVKCKHAKFFYDMFKKISFYEGKDTFSSNPKGRNKTVICEINGYIPLIEDEEKKSIINIDNFDLADPEILDGKFRFLRLVQDDMKQKNLAICDGNLFQSIPESKTSWKFYKTVDEYVEGTYGNIQLAKQTDIDNVQRWMKIKSVEKFSIATHFADFRKIQICYRLIECKDFYFSTTTQEIYKKNELYHTYLYCPLISFDELYDQIEDLLANSLWIEALKRSRVYNISDLASYFSITLDRNNNKKGSNLFVGESNTCKSLLLKAYLHMFPIFAIGFLQDITQFNLSQQCTDKMAVCIEEANGLLRGITSSKLAETLQLAEGGNFAADGKFKNEIIVNSSLFSLCMNLNITSMDADIFNNETLLNRFNITHTHKSDEPEGAKFTGEMAARESPLIVIFSALCYRAHTEKLEFLPKLNVVEDIASVHNCFDIDESKKICLRDSTIYKEGESITKLSKEAKEKKRKADDIKNKIVESSSTKPSFAHDSTTNKYDTDYLPSFSKITNEEKLIKIRGLIMELEKLELVEKLRKEKEARNTANKANGLFEAMGIKRPEPEDDGYETETN